VERWCRERKIARGEVLPLSTVWEWGRRWYSDRLDLGWKRRTVEEMEEILKELGLLGPFWKLR
jgi:hypothetical protein